MRIYQLLEHPDHQGYSLEFYPPRTDKGLVNLETRLKKFAQLERPPTFFDLTWGAGGSTSKLTLKLALDWTQTYPEIPVNMHLTCTQMDPQKISTALREANDGGVDNLVALRGDPPIDNQVNDGVENGETQNQVSEFQCALDLVTYIRQQYNQDQFGLSIAGYPEGHPDQIEPISSFNRSLSPSELGRVSSLGVCPDEKYQADLQYLKRKCQAGGQIIISQMFFDPQVFLQFVKDCRAIGITCPILPGLMLIQNLKGFHKMIKLCKTRVPDWIQQAVQAIEEKMEGAVQGDRGKELEDKATKKEILALGIKVGQWMVRELYAGGVRHFHLYTLNLDQVALPVIEEINQLLDN